jgi:hypothetical protein
MSLRLRAQSSSFGKAANQQRQNDWPAMAAEFKARMQSGTQNAMI